MNELVNICNLLKFAVESSGHQVKVITPNGGVSYTGSPSDCYSFVFGWEIGSRHAREEMNEKE